MSIFRLHLLCSKYIKTSTAIFNNFEIQSGNSSHMLYDRTFRVISDIIVSRTFSTSCYFYKDKESTEDKVTTKSSKYEAFRENQEKRRLKRYSKYLLGNHNSTVVFQEIFLSSDKCPIIIKICLIILKSRKKIILHVFYVKSRWITPPPSLSPTP